MKLPLGLSIALITINITLPPVTTRDVPATSLRDKVTRSLRDAVTRSRGAARRLRYKAQHTALNLKEKLSWNR